MGTANITIEVEEEAAKAFSSASPEEQRKLQLLLSLRLQELTNSSGRTLKEVMDDLSRQAEANGLTPEILETLLSEE